MKYNGYSFEHFEKNDIYEVAKLLIHHWEPDVKENIEHIKWKYYNNPLLKEPIACSIIKGDSIVGFSGLNPFEWELGDDIFELVSFGDGTIHPDHRGKGLYPYLIQSLIDDVKDSKYFGIINISNSPYTSHVMDKMGFISLNKRAYLKKNHYFNIIRDHLFQTRYHDYVSGSLEFSSKPKIEEMICLDEKTKDRKRIHLLKDRRWYNWKTGNKRRNYHYFYNYKHGKLVAYMILLVNKTNSARIVDFAYEKEKEIIEIIKRLTKKNHYRMLIIMDLHIKDDLRRTLRKYGYLEKHFYDFFKKDIFVATISYLPLRTGSEEGLMNFNENFYQDIKNWDFREIASDGL